MCSLFADDCVVYRKTESERDIKIMQDNLSNLELWERKWLMSFNTDKCEVLQIILKPVTPNSYTLYGKHFKGVAEAKYLGVTIECKLFTKHIDTSTCQQQVRLDNKQVKSYYLAVQPYNCVMIVIK